MLWIAVYIPELSLQIAARNHSETEALVISAGAVIRPVVHSVNECAANLGVKAGVTIAAARTLATILNVVARNADSEALAINNLAAWASQFSPSVSIKDAEDKAVAGQEPEGLLIEVNSTLRLYKGLGALLGKIRRGIHALGYKVTYGIAPTPMAAWVFAKARHYGYDVRICQDRSAIEARLADLPLALLDWPHDTLVKLSSMGIVRFADCLALPADGFTKRFGASCWADLHRAIGRLPDPKRYFVVPDNYYAKADFGFEVNDALALLFPLNRLLTEMEGFLRSRSAGTVELTITLCHPRQLQTLIKIGVAKPERHAERMLLLSREQLSRLVLPDTVLAMSIAVDRLLTYQEVSESWLPNPQHQQDGWFQLIDKLVARLGIENIYQLQSVDDHRPEQSWRARPIVAKISATTAAISAAKKSMLASTPRPMFLLNTPRKLISENGRPRLHGVVNLISGPERIESGWWDGKPASRDYYVGRNRHGETMWLYQNHQPAVALDNATSHKMNSNTNSPMNSRASDWYLHGYFA